MLGMFRTTCRFGEEIKESGEEEWCLYFLGSQWVTPLLATYLCYFM